LSSIHLTAACLSAFAGFLQFDEVANICLCDLHAGASHLTVKIPHSKLDQLWNGDEVVIARTGSDTCPVAMLEKYLGQAA